MEATEALKRDRTPERKKLAGSVALPTDAISLLDKNQVAAALNYSPRHLDALVSSGGYPPPDLWLNNRKRWKVQTHNAWVESQCVKS